MSESMPAPNPQTSVELVEEIIKLALIGQSYCNFQKCYRCIDYRYDVGHRKELVGCTLSKIINTIAKLIDDGQKQYDAITDEEKSEEFLDDMSKTIPILDAMHNDTRMDFVEMIGKYYNRSS